MKEQFWSNARYKYKSITEKGSQSGVPRLLIHKELILLSVVPNPTVKLHYPFSVLLVVYGLEDILNQHLVVWDQIGDCLLDYQLLRYISLRMLTFSYFIFCRLCNCMHLSSISLTHYSRSEGYNPLNLCLIHEITYTNLLFLSISASSWYCLANLCLIWGTL